MARTANEVQRDEQIINLLANIWKELQQLNKQLSKNDGKK